MVISDLRRNGRARLRVSHSKKGVWGGFGSLGGPQTSNVPKPAEKLNGEPSSSTSTCHNLSLRPASSHLPSSLNSHLGSPCPYLFHQSSLPGRFSPFPGSLSPRFPSMPSSLPSLSRSPIPMTSAAFSVRSKPRRVVGTPLSGCVSVAMGRPLRSVSFPSPRSAVFI